MMRLLNWPRRICSGLMRLPSFSSFGPSAARLFAASVVESPVAAEPMQRRRRETELAGKLRVGHLAAAGAQKFSELSFQFCCHAAQAGRDVIPDAE